MENKIKIIVGASAVIFIAWIYIAKEPVNPNTISADRVNPNINLEELVAPSEGVTLPVQWGDLGAQMAKAGVIDLEKFKALYAVRGGIDPETESLINGMANGNLKITRENSGLILNLLWALGLGNKNPILETGPMVNYDGNPGSFASTGGWTLANGSVMDHYSQHAFIRLTEEQQALVERVSKNIYRPCCDNPTYFPDCNHGMAMLGFLELMASQGVPENDMYKFALKLNSYWFPDTYMAIAKFLVLKGSSWDRADPKEILGPNYSSASGYQRILQQVAPVNNQGTSCGV